MRDFGVPDFGEVTVAALDGDQLTWTAADRVTGLPYRGQAVLSDLEKVALVPLALRPEA